MKTVTHESISGNNLVYSMEWSPSSHNNKKRGRTLEQFKFYESKSSQYNQESNSSILFRTIFVVLFCKIVPRYNTWVHTLEYYWLFETPVLWIVIVNRKSIFSVKQITSSFAVHFNIILLTLNNQHVVGTVNEIANMTLDGTILILFDKIVFQVRVVVHVIITFVWKHRFEEWAMDLNAHFSRVRFQQWNFCSYL